MAILAAYAVPHPPLIVHAVGHGREEEIQATVAAYREVGRRICELSPETLVISSPHSIMYRDYLHISPGSAASGDFGHFGAPEARHSVRYDEAFVSSLGAAAAADDLAAGTEGEQDPALDHATMVPLHFIEEAYREAGRDMDFRVVRIGLSGLSPTAHYRLGTLIQRVADVLGRRVTYVASGDLSHRLTKDGPYGFAPEGPEFDRIVCDAFLSGDFLPLLAMSPHLAERAAECGLRSFQMMAGALDQTEIHPELLSYEGPFGVGYAVAAFTPCGPERSCPKRDYLNVYEKARAHEQSERRASEDPYVRLARLSLETHVRDGGRVRLPDDLPKDLTLPDELATTRAGCFVSLKKDGELRGCIGTIAPTRESLAEEICANAVSAAVHDPRFAPVRADELDELVYDVDVLSPPEPIEGPEQLDVRRYGVIVSTDDGRRGLLLPDLDGVDTVDEQIDIAARKGGIDLARDSWRLERFEVVRHT